MGRSCHTEGTCSGSLRSREAVTGKLAEACTAGQEEGTAGYSPWLRMWSRKSRSVANRLEQ